ncbi:hypothetical protein EVAR_97348_1 [Eumeta japonica]|uniref:Uncharacterized protein n=1 Tax=Eumeta variegata TaxID=151549 RepID=A0A4C1X730_EUMVA|nr:hypothetical protein EVAR_97348_1 [Eumeta japonica]
MIETDKVTYSRFGQAEAWQNVEFARDARCELEKYQLLSLASTAKDNTVRTLACREKVNRIIHDKGYLQALSSDGSWTTLRISNSSSLSDPVLGPVVAPYLSIVPGSDIVPTLHADPLRLSVRISVLIMISLPLLISASTAYDTSLTSLLLIFFSEESSQYFVRGEEYTAPPAAPPARPAERGAADRDDTAASPPLNHCVRCTPTLHMLYADRHHRPSILRHSDTRDCWTWDGSFNFDRTSGDGSRHDSREATPLFVTKYRQFVIKRNTPLRVGTSSAAPAVFNVTAVGKSRVHNEPV